MKKNLKTMLMTLLILFLMISLVFFGYIAFYNTAKTAKGKEAVTFQIEKTDHSRYVVQAGTEKYFLDFTPVQETFSFIESHPILVPPPIKLVCQLAAGLTD